MPCAAHAPQLERRPKNTEGSSNGQRRPSNVPRRTPALPRSPHRLNPSSHRQRRLVCGRQRPPHFISYCCHYLCSALSIVWLISGQNNSKSHTSLHAFLFLSFFTFFPLSFSWLPLFFSFPNFCRVR